MADRIAGLADRLLAYTGGSDPVDPAEREALGRLAEVVAARLGSRSSRSGRGTAWRKEEVTAALAGLAAEDEAIRLWIERLSGPAAALRPGPRDPLAGEKTATRPTFQQTVDHGSTGVQLAGDLRLGGSGELADLLRAPRPAGSDAQRPGSGERRAEIRPRPDLEIRVHEEHSTGISSLVFEVSAAHPDLQLAARRFGPFRLRGDLRSHAEQIFATIGKERTPGGLAQKLAGIGRALSRELLGCDDLAELLWGLRHRAGTLLLRSEEPWIPWELVQLRKPGANEDAPFLCETFAMTRWLGDAAPPVELPLRRLAVVAARKGDPQAAREEQEDLLRRDGARRSVQLVAARFDPLLEALSSGGYDGWHFCGHGLIEGGNPTAAAFPLDDNRWFSPRDLLSAAAGLGRGRPLVFINGCHTGRIGWSLISMGGWAQQAIDAGAGAFVGALWAIEGTSAAAFARAFYESFCDRGVPFGKAVQQARQALRAAGDPNWLAYSAYGHPLAGV